MNFNEARSAVHDAKNTIDTADLIVRELASIMIGRLRAANVWCSDLKKLKRELQDFNASTGKWIDRT